ncbi:outer membrane beta-barrel protein [uncultured Flavobacterium sp.]|uniref:outer membrane beta-barrel protein n=1 Tax=uncultured Flavobacterium sp. TaxID=165435 RepID=UPI0025EFA4CF|nr:outer membrane beta-barrel protein [uncultured Flavobacterium sp.]
MHKFLLILVLFSIAGYGQSVTLKGVVADSTGIALESATIYLMRAKDSTVVDYTISGKSGGWELKVPAMGIPATLKISFVGMASHKEELTAVDKDRNFGTVKLMDLPTELSEVVIDAEIPPIRIKKDTLEFNAASFRVRPDANVEALLKQLPGVVITPDRKITVNGKEVNQVLVNGKPFFDADGKIALQNLPADMIDKVQVTDTRTKKEELARQQASGDNASINLTIKKDKNKGLFGRVTGGYGSARRHEASGLVNYFKDKKKLSVLASSNNINASGFSMNEVFGSLGRGSGLRSFSSGGNAAGITLSNTLGVNYSDEWFRDFESASSYNYSNTSTENRRRYSATNYLPESEDTDNPGTLIDKSYRTGSSSRSDGDTYSHSINSDFQYRIDSTATVHYRPVFRSSGSTGSSSSESFSQRLADSKLLNESTASSYSESNDENFNSNLNYFKRFAKKGRGISINATNANSSNERTNLNRSNTVRYKYPAGQTEVITDNRNQLLANTGKTDLYNASVEFIEPLTDSLKLNIIANYHWNKDTDRRESYDYDPALDSYSLFNDSLSNYLSSRTVTLGPSAGLSLDQSKLRASADAGLQFTNFRNHAYYMGENYRLEKNYIVPQANARATYRFSKSKSVYANYRYTVSFPSATQLLPVIDISNPLNTITGNPRLDPTSSHSIRAGFRNFNTAMLTGFNLAGSLMLYNDEVVQYTEIDDSAKRETSYRNISGTMASSVSINWNKTFKKEAHEWLLNTGISANFSTDKGYLNTQRYNSRSIGLSPNLNLSYRYGELVTITPSYNFSYNQYTYDNYSVGSASGFMHIAGLEATSYWPKHTVVGADLAYTYNSNVPDGFRKDFYLLNTSIGYNFLKDQLMLKAKVYDLLNQNTGVKRTVDPTSVTNEENTVLKRYIMFSLTWKFNKFGTAPSTEFRRGPVMRPMRR